MADLLPFGHGAAHARRPGSRQSLLTPEEEEILTRLERLDFDGNGRPATAPWIPATPLRPLRVDGLHDVWIKDESGNPTGTHKDRMAWVILTAYRDLLRARAQGISTGPLPAMSVISAGSAALAIQTVLRRFGLPDLKVVTHASIRAEIVDVLASLGCEVFRTDLHRQSLTPADILQISHNPNGFDITSCEALEPHRFYDALSREVLACSPGYCFLPFGSGTLYTSLLKANRRAVAHRLGTDFPGCAETLRGCHFFGATTRDPLSRADKLYSVHLPFSECDDQWIRFYRSNGYCGTRTGIYPLSEPCLEEAMEIARAQGVACEPSGIAGLALLLQMRAQMASDARLVVVCTGRTRWNPAEITFPSEHPAPAVPLS